MWPIVIRSSQPSSANSRTGSLNFLEPETGGPCSVLAAVLHVPMRVIEANAVHSYIA